ncbi:MAG: hypothetical protein WBX27_11900 [Specibacter sp.]
MGRPLTVGRRPATFDRHTFVLAAAPVTVIAGALGMWLLLIAGDIPATAASNRGQSMQAAGNAPFAATAVLAFAVTMGSGLICAVNFANGNLSARMRRVGVAITITLTGFMAAMFMGGLQPRGAAPGAAGMDWLLVWAGTGMAALLGGMAASHVPTRRGNTDDGESPAGARQAEVPAVTIGGLTVTVSTDAVNVLLWKRWRVIQVPLATIGAAMALPFVQPKHHGGWGYRSGPWGTTLLLRRGPALLLSVAGGREVVVSTDALESAERMAGILNALVLAPARRHA